MTLAAILYRHLGQSVPAVPELSRQSGTTETIAPQPVPVVPAVPEEKQGSKSVTERQRAFLNRDPLVTEEDLHLIQTHLLRHLTYCRDCWESRNASIEVPSQRQPIHDYAAVEGL